MKLLVLDTETTGLDEDSEVIEIACAIFDVATKSMLQAYSWLLHPGMAIKELEATTIHKISDDTLEAAKTLSTPDIETFYSIVDALVAHNAPFDKKMLAKVSPRCLTCKWIDSKTDIVYPHEQGSKRLIHLAADNGVWMPGHHRALVDVMMLVALLAQVPNLETQIQRALKPRVLIQAILPYERREEAKEQGFNWNSTTRHWEKLVPEDEMQSFYFQTRRIGSK